MSKNQEKQIGTELRCIVASMNGWSVSAKDGNYVICMNGVPRHYGIWTHKTQPLLNSFVIAPYLPHYEADVNEMNKVEELFTDKQRASYYGILLRMCGNDPSLAISATAENRAQAFVQVFSKHAKERHGQHECHESL